MSRSTALDALKATLKAEDIHPAWTPAPMCSDGCPSHNGRRCRVLGWRPGPVCEPAAARLAQRLADILEPR